MVAEPVPERELAALHTRISRDLAELRTRWSRWSRVGRASPDELVNAVMRTFRALRALQEAVAGARSTAALLAFVIRHVTRRHC